MSLSLSLYLITNLSISLSPSLSLSLLSSHYYLLSGGGGDVKAPPHALFRARHVDLGRLHGLRTIKLAASPEQPGLSQDNLVTNGRVSNLTNSPARDAVDDWMTDPRECTVHCPLAGAPGPGSPRPGQLGRGDVTGVY